MAAETGFMIDGVLYEVPSLDSLNMDEAQVLYDYSGLSLQDFGQPEDVDEAEHKEQVAQKVKNPGFIRALMHIAYQRGNPRLSPSRVKSLVGAAEFITAVEHLAEEEGDEPRPPALTTEPDGSSPKSSEGSSESSGTPSHDDTDEPAAPAEATTGGSSQPSESTRTLSVA